MDTVTSSCSTWKWRLVDVVLCSFMLVLDGLVIYSFLLDRKAFVCLIGHF